MSHTYSEDIQWERISLAGCTSDRTSVTPSAAWSCNILTDASSEHSTTKGKKAP
jgi:hypothetical protein